MVATDEKRKAGHCLPRRMPSWLSCHRIAIFGNRHYSPALDRRLHCDPIGCADGWATAATHAFGSVGGQKGLGRNVTANDLHRAIAPAERNPASCDKGKRPEEYD